MLLDPSSGAHRASGFLSGHVGHGEVDWSTRTSDVGGGGDFGDFLLPRAILLALRESGFVKASPVQSAVIPAALSGEKPHIIAQAKSGTGKTCAFVTVLLTLLCQSDLCVDGLADGDNRVMQSDTVRVRETQAPRVLVVAPSRELATQTLTVVRAVGRRLVGLKSHACIGGLSVDADRRVLAAGAHVVVGTPGRLQALLAEEALSTSALQCLVLDEVDRFFHTTSLREQMDGLLEHLPSCQTLAVSASFTDAVIDRIRADWLDDTRAVRQVMLSPDEPSLVGVSQQYVLVDAGYGSTQDHSESQSDHSESQSDHSESQSDHIESQSDHRERERYTNGMLLGVRHVPFKGKKELFVSGKYLLRHGLTKYKKAKRLGALFHWPYRQYVHQQKLLHLRRVLCTLPFRKCLVFCNTRNHAHAAAQGLRDSGFVADVLTAQLSQVDRIKVMRRLRRGETRIVVSSDLIARGVDLRDVDVVVNFDTPSDPATFLHRCGRAGRFGGRGFAISLCDSYERRLLKWLLTEALSTEDATALDYRRLNRRQLQRVHSALTAPANAAVVGGSGTVAESDTCACAPSGQLVADIVRRSMNAFPLLVDSLAVYADRRLPVVCLAWYHI
ncbi:MAG: hypothetical protein MHM6MM_002492 [Cercozoa sp. M6MM]